MLWLTLETAVSFKDVLAILASPEQDGGVVALAGQLADQWSAQVAMIVMASKPGMPEYSDAWLSDRRYDQLILRARLKAETARRAVEAQVERKIAWPRVETLMVLPDDVRDAVGRSARLQSLTLAGRPDSPLVGDVHTPVIEGALLYGGRPIMIVPPGWSPALVGRRVVIGWNASREASRALADAMPIVETAAFVSIVAVDVQPQEGGPGPLVQLERYLQRRGVASGASLLESKGRSIAETLLDHCARVDADLVIVGGYGRPRLAETIFGGVTRDLLSLASLPMLMSH